jgi:hypothetical protein
VALHQIPERHSKLVQLPQNSKAVANEKHGQYLFTRVPGSTWQHQRIPKNKYSQPELSRDTRRALILASRIARHLRNGMLAWRIFERKESPEKQNDTTRASSSPRTICSHVFIAGWFFHLSSAEGLGCGQPPEKGATEKHLIFHIIFILNTATALQREITRVAACRSSRYVAG